MDKKAVIIGAGVIGLTLAKELTLGGIDTKVYDSKRVVSEGSAKASGILSVTGLNSAGIPYKDSIINTLNGAILHAGKEVLRIKAREPKAYVIDRGMLAESCMKLAESAGAEVILSKRMSKTELLQIADNKDNILVGADGAVSTVASTFNFPGISEYVLTYKAEYDAVNIEDKSMVGLFFSNEMTNRFFGWTVPYSDQRMEVGLGISSGVKANSYVAFKRFVNGGLLGTLFENAERVNGYASIIPLSCRKITVKGNVLLVGDAAGQVKATTGGGIIFGSLCAKVLAKVIVDNVSKGSPLSVYEKEWRKRYGMELKMHKLLHRYYSGLKTGGFEALFKLSKMFGAEEFFSMYGDMDRPSLILKRVFLRGLAK